MPCEIAPVDQQTLGVHYKPSNTGSATVILDIGKLYRFITKRELHLTVLPSCPAKLNILELKHNHQFVGHTTEVEVAYYDCFGNEATACQHEVTVESDPEAAVTLIDSILRDGKYVITLRCDMQCRAQIQITLGQDGESVRKGHPCPEPEIARKSQSLTGSFSLDICYPPISVEQSTVKIVSSSNCQVNAGTPIKLEVEINDQFGQPAHTDLNYNISPTIGPMSESRIIPTSSHSKIFIEIVPTHIGQHPVNVKLNGKSLPQSNSLHDFSVFPSIPRHLHILTTRCSTPKDPSFPLNSNALYYGDWSSLQADITDEYGNTAVQTTNIDNCDFQMKAIDSEGSTTIIRCEDLKLDRGKIDVKFRLQQVGEHKLVVRLSNKRNRTQSIFETVDINVLEAPCSPVLSQEKFKEKCTKQIQIAAGSEYKFNVQIYDVFGNPVRHDSKAPCTICPQKTPFLHDQRSSGKQLEEYVKVEKDSQSTLLLFNVTLLRTSAGITQVKLVINSDDINSITRSISVVPLLPHHLNNLRFITTSTSTPNCVTIEADVVDIFENVVTCMDENYEIRAIKSSVTLEDKTESSDEATPVAVGKLRIDVNLDGTKKQKISVTLARKSAAKEEYELQKVEIQAIEISFSFSMPTRQGCHTLIAGNKFKFHIFPFEQAVDATTANSTAEFMFSGNSSIAAKYGLIAKVSLTLNTACKIHLEVFHNGKKSLEAKLEVKPDLDKVCCEHTMAKVTPVYTKEPLLQTMAFTDCFGNRCHLDYTCPPRLLQTSGPKCGLQLKSCNTKVSDNICNFDYHFDYQGEYNVSLQCPDLKGHYRDVEQFSVNVQNAPVDSQRSAVTWLPQFRDMPDQPLFKDDKYFKCKLILRDFLGHNYMGDVTSADLSVVSGDKQVIIRKKSSLGQGVLEVTVPLDDFQICSNQTVEFSFVFNGHKIVTPLQLHFNGYLKYNDKQCEVRSVSRNGDPTTKTYAIQCKNVTEKEIKGEDNSHFDNIRRIFNLKKSDGAEIVEKMPSTLLILPQSFPPHQLDTCRSILLKLLRALYYRKRAFEADKEREKWKQRATENYEKIREKKDDCGRPTFCKKIKKNYAKLMKEYNRDACEEIFAFYNFQRGQNEIDLHGLLVADEDKLKNHELMLVQRGRTKDEVKRIIETERDEGDEAIRKVRERLENFNKTKASNERKTWLEIIVGSGHHSTVKGRQTTRPKVEEYLCKNERRISPVNKGALVVTFEEYAGTGRCFGEYFAKNAKTRGKVAKAGKGNTKGVTVATQIKIKILYNVFH